VFGRSAVVRPLHPDSSSQTVSRTTLTPNYLNKYHAKKTEYNGVLYHSQREAAYAVELDLLKRARGKDRIASWRRQIRIPLLVNGMKICDYVVDFELTFPDGSIELVEIKGFETAIFKLKLKLFRASWLRDNPTVKYSIVK
jgi:hypothetical protein